MTRVPRARDHDQLPKVHPAQRSRAEATRSTDGWTRDLTVLDGGAVLESGALYRPRRVRARVTIRVLLAEPVGLVRAGVRSLLEKEYDITVAGEALSGPEAIALAKETRPDVVLMDIDLPGLDGLAATRRILADPDLSGVRVVILTADERDEDLFGALRSEASGFLPLDTEPADLLRAVRVVAGGGAQLSPWATRRLLEEFASVPDPQSAHAEQFEELTTRERDIVLLVAEGLSNGEIAQRLVISPATAKTHVSRAMLKLHASDRAKLVALAHRTGFVTHHRAVDTGVAGGTGPNPAKVQVG
jgi:DNA-binding NarL/FixJ family response regulator